MNVVIGVLIGWLSSQVIIYGVLGLVYLIRYIKRKRYERFILNLRASRRFYADEFGFRSKTIFDTLRILSFMQCMKDWEKKDIGGNKDEVQSR